MRRKGERTKRIIERDFPHLVEISGLAAASVAADALLIA
jgi:hypothetical protein